MKVKNYLSILRRHVEEKRFLSDKFHEATNNISLSLNTPKEFLESWTKIHFKTYPRFEKILLEFPKNYSQLVKIMRQRRSVRIFSGDPVSLKELSYLLYSSCGIINIDKNLDNSRRPYPSAGARFPLEIYTLILNCKEVEKSLYHYNVVEHSLETILNQDLTDWLSHTTGKDVWITKSSIVIIVTGVLDRTRIKYGDRGYRFVLLEAGHLAQNFCLVAEEQGLGSCVIGGYIDDEVNKLLDIQHTKEVSLYLIVIGKL